MCSICAILCDLLHSVALCQNTFFSLRAQIEHILCAHFALILRSICAHFALLKSALMYPFAHAPQHYFINTGVARDIFCTKLTARPRVVNKLPKQIILTIFVNLQFNSISFKSNYRGVDVLLWSPPDTTTVA